MQRKVENIKPTITITIPYSDYKQNAGCLQFQQLYMKPLYSAKNERKTLAKFNFDCIKIQPPIKKVKQKRLEKDNEVLINSLAALKIGAVSAIAEKQDQIDQLRSHFGWQQEIKAIQQQVQDLYQERRQLREQIQQLEEKLQNERQGFLRMLQQKERVIEELYSELGSTQIHIQNLQKYEEIKEKKIKIIEQENQVLFQQLQFQKINHLGQQSTKNDSDTPQHLSYVHEDSYESSSTSKDNIIIIHDLELQKLKQIQQKHKQQLNQLAAFYQKRIFQMRQIYDRELYSIPLQSKLKNTPENVQYQAPYSYNQTQVAPKKLSYQLINMPKISDCYSITKRNLSKADSLSIFTLQKQNFITQKKSFDNTANLNSNILINTVTNQKVVQRKNENQHLQQTKATNNTEQQKSQQKSYKFSIGSFLFGAVSGGGVATLLCNLIKG